MTNNNIFSSASMASIHSKQLKLDVSYEMIVEVWISGTYWYIYRLHLALGNLSYVTLGITLFIHILSELWESVFRNSRLYHISIKSWVEYWINNCICLSRTPFTQYNDCCLWCMCSIFKKCYGIILKMSISLKFKNKKK